MNVTIKLKDELCREARHRAVDCGESLSGWIAEIVRRELARGRVADGSLLELLGDGNSEDREVVFPRDRGAARHVEL